MYLGWLIYEKKDMLENKGYIDWFINEASKQQMKLKLILREDMVYGIRNNKRYIHNNSIKDLPDFAVVRTIEPLLSIHLEAMKIVVFNNSTISEIANDKAVTHQKILDLNIPMVHTIFFKRNHLLPNPPLSYPFIVKATKGRGGNEVYWIESEKDWIQLLKIPLAEDLIIQETNVQVGKDMRVFVVGKEIIGAVLRFSTTDHRANFKLGGSATFIELNEQQIDIVMKIVNAFDFGMIGIDFLINAKGHLIFNEIEDIVGSRTLSAVTEINILEAYCTFIKEKLDAL